MTDETITVTDVRWVCPRCSRFIPEASVRSWDYQDPGAYYGVSSRTVGVCSRHGEVDEPRCVAIREREVPYTEDDCLGTSFSGHGCRYCRSDAELDHDRVVL